LIVVGLLLLFVALVGRFSGNPGLVKGLRIMNVIICANTMLLLAILVKLLEKK
jgi:hypothetical protein